MYKKVIGFNIIVCCIIIANQIPSVLIFIVAVVFCTRFAWKEGCVIVGIVKLQAHYSHIRITCADSFKSTVFISGRKYQGTIVCITQFIGTYISWHYPCYHVVRTSILHHLYFYFLLRISDCVSFVINIEANLLVSFVAVYFCITAYYSRYIDLFIQYPEAGFEDRLATIRIVINSHDIIA